MCTLPEIKTQVVRDLLWGCFGPDLIDQYQKIAPDQTINTCHITLTRQRIAWFVALDQHPEPLLHYLSSLNKPRLGQYFEALWQYFINNDPLLELITHNLAIRDKHRTLGEFDIIYYDSTTQSTYHLELAVKFYLYVYNQACRDNSLSHWIGPNRRDRLDKKLSRILSHQIRLSECQQAQSALKTLGTDTVHKEIALKGILFYPESFNKQSDDNHVESLHYLSNKHRKGHWYKYSSFCQQLKDKQTWYILPRIQWISRYADNNNTPSMLNSQQLKQYLMAYFQTNTQPLVICLIHKQCPQDIEIARYFITADTWGETEFIDSTLV